jgi:hypothetical protein
MKIIIHTQDREDGLELVKRLERFHKDPAPLRAAMLHSSLKKASKIEVKDKEIKTPAIVLD